MSDADLLANIKAREELKQRGWVWVKCEMCAGRGGEDCKCDGRGGYWQAPITK